MTVLRLAVLLVLAASPAALAAQDAGTPETAEAGAAEAAEIRELEPALSGAGLEAAAETRVAAVPRRAPVMDELDLGRTEITGNQELPKVLYIVPWKQSDPGDLMGRPVGSLLDEVLAPVDREVFRRRVSYYQSLLAEPSAGEESGD